MSLIKSKAAFKASTEDWLLPGETVGVNVTLVEIG